MKFVIAEKIYKGNPPIYFMDYINGNSLNWIEKIYNEYSLPEKKPFYNEFFDETENLNSVEDIDLSSLAENAKDYLSVK